VYFHVRRAHHGAWTVVHVVGEVDLATAPEFRAELVAATKESGALAIDLTDCDLVDSVGLGVTLGAARRVRSSGGRFAVVASGVVRRAFERTRLDEILDVVESMSALEAVPLAEGGTGS
jgi:anti-sigma B factor antagonist